VASKTISEPVKDVESLKKMIKERLSCIELPDLRFAEMKTVNGPDIIVDAGGFGQVHSRKKIPADKLDVKHGRSHSDLDGKCGTRARLRTA